MNSRDILLLLVGLMTAIVLFNFLSAPKNCWDNYTTENEAITNCEATNE